MMSYLPLPSRLRKPAVKSTFQKRDSQICQPAQIVAAGAGHLQAAIYQDYLLPLTGKSQRNLCRKVSMRPSV